MKPRFQNNISGNLNVSGFVTGVKCGAYAALTAPANTTVTSLGVYYPIIGTFSNTPAELFSGTADPSIRYDGTLTQYFEVDWHATISSNHSACTVTIGIKKSGNLQTTSVMSTLCKSAGELYSVSGTVIVSLAQNDTIQLVVTADGDGDVITFNNFTTSIREFFD